MFDSLDLQPSMRSLDALNIIGCAGEFQPGATQEIGALWAAFAPRIAEVRNRRGMATYGLCLMPPPESAVSDRFTYVAGVDSQALDDIPEGMSGHEVPARNYAVFAHQAGIGPELPKTLDYIFGKWLPDSGYVQDGADFEYYDERFNPVTGQGTFFIYVPVRAG